MIDSDDRFADPSVHDIPDSLSSNTEMPLNLQSFTFRDAGGANTSSMAMSKML